MRDTIRVVVQVTRLRSTHPWVRVRTVVFADDTIGTNPEGELAKVDHDVVVTAIVPAPDGDVLVVLRPFDDSTT